MKLPITWAISKVLFASIEDRISWNEIEETHEMKKKECMEDRSNRYPLVFIKSVFKRIY